MATLSRAIAAPDATSDTIDRVSSGVAQAAPTSASDIGDVLVARSRWRDGAPSPSLGALSIALFHGDLPLAFGPLRGGAASHVVGPRAGDSPRETIMPLAAPNGSGMSGAMPLVVARAEGIAAAPYELPAAAPISGPVMTPAAAAAHSNAAEHKADRGAEADIDDIVDRAWRALMSRLAIEQERRGFGRWA